MPVLKVQLGINAVSRKKTSVLRLISDLALTSCGQPVLAQYHHSLSGETVVCNGLTRHMSPAASQLQYQRLCPFPCASYLDKGVEHNMVAKSVFCSAVGG